MCNSKHLVKRRIKCHFNAEAHFKRGLYNCSEGVGALCGRGGGRGGGGAVVGRRGEEETEEVSGGTYG